MFFPMSWMSPLTVAMRTVPRPAASLAASRRKGSRASMPIFIVSPLAMS